MKGDHKAELMGRIDAKKRLTDRKRFAILCLYIKTNITEVFDVQGDRRVREQQK